MSISSTLSALRKASRGLMYFSEKDAPFRAIAWEDAPAGRLSKAKIRELTGHDEDDPVEETTLSDCFRGHVVVQKWHASDDKAAVKRYKELVQTIEEHLTDVRVYKVGKAKLDVYIMGKTEDGSWAGLKTQSLET